MEKPFLVCHMFVSMDGKIDGAFMGDPAAAPARGEYGRLRGLYNCTATIYGATTMQAFADGIAQKLPAAGAQIARGDHLAPIRGTGTRPPSTWMGPWHGIPATTSGRAGAVPM